MPKDLTIRLLGRPQVTEDDQVGYHKLTRQYVIEGYRAEFSEVNHPQNPLFLAVGTEDEEYENHFLVDQKINPAQGSLDKAYLVRVYAEIRDTHVQESVTSSKDLRRLRRTYVVLRAEHTRGYSKNGFSNHPLNNKYVSQETRGDTPWDYAPNIVATPPKPVSYGMPNYEGYVNKAPGLASGDETAGLYETLSSNHATEINTGEWLKGSAQVSMSQPGVDVWSVEWVSHVKPYWSSSLKKIGGKSQKVPKIVEFDNDGLRITGASGSTGASAYGQVSQLNFFVVGKTIPPQFGGYVGTTSNLESSVMLDFSLIAYEGHRRSFDFHQYIPNAVFAFSVRPDNKLTTNIINGYRFVGNYYNGDSPQNLPKFKNVKIADGGGTITWTHIAQQQTGWSSIMGVQIQPIFTSSDTSEDRRIWQISITYVG
jgi:hypothetical protein